MWVSPRLSHRDDVYRAETTEMNLLKCESRMMNVFEKLFSGVFTGFASRAIWFTPRLCHKQGTTNLSLSSTMLWRRAETVSHT